MRKYLVINLFIYAFLSLSFVFEDLSKPIYVKISIIISIIIVNLIITQVYLKFLLSKDNVSESSLSL